jgi:hypothetical protein
MGGGSVVMDYDKLVDAWLKNKGIEDTKKYVQQGGRFKDLTIEELKSLWVAAFGLFATTFKDGPDRLDLESELALRGEKIPYELVKTEHEALINKARAYGVMIEQDPTLLARFEDLAEEMDEFEREINRPKN